MGKFRFASLLKIREAERNEKKNAFLEAENRRQQALQELSAIDQKLAFSQEESRRARKLTLISPVELQRFQAIRIQLSEERQKAQERLKLLTEESETKRSELNNAIKEVKILQTLKDKTEERELEEERRRDVKTLDELASQQKALERREDENLQ